MKIYVSLFVVALITAAVLGFHFGAARTESTVPVNSEVTTPVSGNTGHAPRFRREQPRPEFRVPETRDVEVAESTQASPEDADAVAQQHTLERNERLLATYEDQAVDSGWGRRTSNDIWNAVAQLAQDGVAVTAVDCRTSWCAVDLNADPAKRVSAQAFATSLKDQLSADHGLILTSGVDLGVQGDVQGFRVYFRFRARAG